MSLYKAVVGTERKGGRRAADIKRSECGTLGNEDAAAAASLAA
jgi:hypothetical protein